MAKPKINGTKTSLVDLAKSLKPANRATWFDRADPELQAELLALRKAFQAKQLPAYMTMRRIFNDVIKPLHPDLCSESVFRRWMAEACNG